MDEAAWKRAFTQKLYRPVPPNVQTQDTFAGLPATLSYVRTPLSPNGMVSGPVVNPAKALRLRHMCMSLLHAMTPLKGGRLQWEERMWYRLTWPLRKGAME